MRKFLLLLMLLCIEKALHAQYVYTIKADSVKITNSCDTAELIIENHTQTVPGFLFNKGRGRTEFRRGLVNVSDGIYIIGADTLDFNKVVGGQYYKQGGNQFGTTGTLGLKDNYPLTFIQHNIERGRIDTSGHWLFNTTTDRGYLAQFNGDIWDSGVIYQAKNVSIVPIGGAYGDKRINIGGNSVIGDGAIALGSGVIVDGTGVAAIGMGNQNTVANGIGLLGSTDRGVAIGSGSYAHQDGVAIGHASVTTTGNQFVCGGPDNVGEDRSSFTVTDVYFGSGVQRGSTSGRGRDYTINGSGAYGTDSTGGSITIAGGKGTGAGTPGSVIFAIATPTSSGTTLQMLSEKARIDANGNFGIGTSTPAANLHVTGTGRFDNVVITTGHRSAIRNITANTTLVSTDEYVFGDATSGALTVTLPTATGRDGQTFTIKKTDNSSNAVSVASAGSQFIDGNSTYSLTSQYTYVTIVANSGNWMIVAKN